MSEDSKQSLSATKLLIEIRGEVKEMKKLVELMHLNHQTFLNEIRSLKMALAGGSLQKSIAAGSDLHKGGTVKTDAVPPEAIPLKTIPGLKKPVGKGEVMKKYPAQQKILYPDGKNKVANADFTITDTKTDKLIVKGKTNVTGMWRANLASGVYAVTISKYGTEDKPAIQLAYQVEINGSGPAELADMKGPIE